MTNLTFLDLEANQLTSFTLPPGMTRLSSLRLGANQLTSFTLPAGMTNLAQFAIAVNQLTNLALPSDLFNVVSFDLGENLFSNFIFPRGLTNLVSVDLGLCQMTNLTLAPDMTQLTSLFVDGNPFTTFVISEPLAATNLAALVSSLQNQGVSLRRYPLSANLLPAAQPVRGGVKITLTGPPGIYTVLGSTNLTSWNVSGSLTNNLGSAIFTDLDTDRPLRKFYRAHFGP
jgi:internalin A